MKFVGRTDVEQVQTEMREILLKIMTENIDHIDFIEQVIREGSESNEKPQ